MSLLGDFLKYFGITGSTVLDIPGTTTPDATNLRRGRCDANVRLEVTGVGGTIPALIYGVAGNGTTQLPMRQVLFNPCAGVTVGGYRGVVGAVSAVVTGVVGLRANQTYHLESTVHAWVERGIVGSTPTAQVGNEAGVGSTHLSPGKVYEYIPGTDGRELAVIRDTLETSDGVIFITPVED